MSNIGVSKEFHDFGKFIQIAAVLTVLSIITGTAGLIATIFIFVAMGCLKRANYTLNNASLHKFRSKYIKGFISRICGMVVLVIGGINLALFFFFSTPSPYYITLSLSTILMISGIVLIYVGVAAEMKAWKNLQTFFENNGKLFPTDIAEEAIKGCNELKKGTLLISLWFLIIPAIIGFIYQVKGYFKLATLNGLPTHKAPETSEMQPFLPKPQPISTRDQEIKYCPNCGAKTSGLGNFCALCGSEIR